MHGFSSVSKKRKKKRFYPPKRKEKKISDEASIKGPNLYLTRYNKTRKIYFEILNDYIVRFSSGR